MGLNKSSRTVNAKKNIGTSLINKFISLILIFISRKLFIQYIGIDYLGINGLFANVLTLLSIADLGLDTAMNINFYKPIAEKDTNKIAALIQFYRKLYIIVGSTIAAIGLLLIPALPYIINLQNPIEHITVYYVIFLANTVFSYFYIYKASIIQADQKNYLINRIDMVINFCKLVAQIVVIVVFKNYLFYVLLNIVFTLMRNLIISHTADKQYPFIKQKVKLEKKTKDKIFKDVSSMFIYKIGWTLINGTDSLLMSIIVGTASVGYFANYTSLTGNLEGIIALIYVSLNSSVGNLVATTNSDSQYRTFRIMQFVSYWICGVVVVCLYFLTEDFVVMWIGKEFLLDKFAFIAILISVHFTTCMRPVWAFREGTGMYQKIKYVTLVTAFINIVLSIILGKRFGLGGIIIATSISRLSTYFWVEVKILYNSFFDRSSKEYFLNYAINVLMVLLCIFILKNIFVIFPDVSVINWLLKAFISIVVVLVVYYARYCKTEEFKAVKEKVSEFLDGRRAK